MINIPTLIFFLGVYLTYKYFIKPYLIDAPAIRRRKEEIDKKEKDKGEFIDYEEVE